MKWTIAICCIFLLVVACGEKDADKAESTNLVKIDQQWTDYSALLTDYVADGQVDYKTLKADRGRLDKLIDSISVADLSGLSDDTRLAFYINAYNIIILRSIIDAYPIASIQDIKGAFDKTAWTIAGPQMTLDDLKDDVIREDFADSRTHFALCPGAKGGPALASVPYLGDILDEQLNRAGKNFALDTKYNWIDTDRHAVGLSKIFEHYGSDFIRGYYIPHVMLMLCKEENASVNFIINQYPPDRQEKLRAGDYKVKFLDYDWSLNDISK